MNEYYFNMKVIHHLEIITRSLVNTHMCIARYMEGYVYRD